MTSRQAAIDKLYCADLIVDTLDQGKMRIQDNKLICFSRYGIRNGKEEWIFSIPLDNEEIEFREDMNTNNIIVTSKFVKFEFILYKKML